MAGAHTVGYNKIAIGIAAIGNFEEYPMPEAQWQGLVNITRQVMDEHSIPLDKVLGHGQVAATLCPGKYFPMEQIKKELESVNMDVFRDLAKCMYPGIVEEAKRVGLYAGYQETDGLYCRPHEPLSNERMIYLLMRLYGKVRFKDDIANVIETCRPQTVTIYALKDGGGLAGSGGSGCIFTPDGRIVTNAHVVDGYSKFEVHHGKDVYKASLVKQGATWDDNNVPRGVMTNMVLDIAEIQIKGVKNLPTVTFATQMPRDGWTTVIIGSPLLIEGWASSGIISRKTNYFLDTDTAINPGNSGGGMFNLAGEYVGMPTQKYTGAEIDNLGNCIRADAVQAFLEGRYNDIKF